MSKLSLKAKKSPKPKSLPKGVKVKRLGGGKIKITHVGKTDVIEEDFLPAEKSENVSDGQMELPFNEVKKNKRTTLQNNAMHLWFDQIAETLNEAGLDQKVVFSKYTMDVPWHRESVKEEIWRRAQSKMFKKKSTTELNTAEVTKVYDVVNRFLSENFGVHIPFPSIETLFDENK